jgi:antirestriction protein ArdC
VTYKQAKELGGHVRKGEESTLVVFWKVLRKKDRESGKDKSFPMLRYYRVWNLEQTEGVRIPKDRPMPTDEPEAGFNPVDNAEAIASGYPDGPPISYDGGDRAYFIPALDEIHLPKRETFVSAAAFYSTLFHEQTHSTGHKSRLNREGISDHGQVFGNHEYGREELIAEMGAAFLCAEAGLDPSDHLANSAAYIGSWMRKIREDKRAVVVAAGAAQKAVDHILGRKPVDFTPDTDDSKDETDVA